MLALVLRVEVPFVPEPSSEVQTGCNSEGAAMGLCERGTIGGAGARCGLLCVLSMCWVAFKERWHGRDGRHGRRGGEQ